MSFVIFGDSFTFPDGFASTNRVYAYAKGLTENGVDVHVICFRNDYLKIFDGTIDGIRYYHPFGQTERNKSFIIRRLLKVRKYFRAISLFRKIHRENRITEVTVYTMLLTTHFFSWCLSKAFKNKILKECSEHPLGLYQRNILKKFQGWIKLKIEIQLSDAIFCISRFLIDFYKDQGLSARKLFLIPSTVDPSRFSQIEENPFSFPYVGYFGGLTFGRDNIDTLIKAFAIIHNKHPKLKLVFGGFYSESEKSQMDNIISDLKISSKVILLNSLTRDEITRYIVNSYVLVMVRSKDLESQASFPSKLTEYLATGKPVITVNVGEVSDYLIDGVNSFIVEAENFVELAEKLHYVINNYELALQVAERGRELTYNTFNYNFQAQRVIRFIETLHSVK